MSGVLESARAIAGQIRDVFGAQQVALPDYEQLIAEDDHVHAAAAAAVTPSILLTSNTEHLPASELESLGVTVRHPDDYFVDLLVAEPDAMREVLADMSSDRHHPPMTVTEVVKALGRAGLVSFGAAFEAS